MASSLSREPTEAVVLFEYEKQEEDELDLKVGDILQDVKQVEDGWCKGTLRGVRGMFPDNFVEMRTVGNSFPPTILPTSSLPLVDPLQYSAAPALTPSNVAKAVDGVNLESLRIWLNVPDSEIQHSYSSDEERREQVVHYWLEKDPTASWRRVIWALDVMGAHEAAERILQYSEPLTDPTLTSPRVTTVLQTVPTERWFEGGLGVYLRIPLTKRNEIKRQSTTEKEKRTAYVDYWLGMAPGASWQRLAGALYHVEKEEAALGEARKCFQRQKDPTLTLDSLHAAAKGVQNWSLLGSWIDIPRSKREQIKSQYSDDDQRLKALLEEWLKNHPAPSWNLLAEGLYRMEEHDLLQRVQEQYITASEQCLHIYEVMKEPLSSIEVNRHRVDPSTALAAPLVLHFPHNPDVGVFCSLIAFLLSRPAPWKIVVDSSGPVCCFRNCVELSIPKHPGSITIIDTGDFFEVHVNIKHDKVGIRKCPELCHIVSDAVLEVLRKAVTIYGNCEPQRAFICPCSKGSSHSATIGDDETYWVCSRNPSEYGDLQPNQMVWLSKAGHRKSLDSDSTIEVCDVLTACGFSRADWNMLSERLSKDIDVEAVRQEKSTPERCLQEIIRQWLQKDTEAS